MLWSSQIAVRTENAGSDLIFEGKGFNQIQCVGSSGPRVVGLDKVANSFLLTDIERVQIHIIFVHLVVADNKGKFLTRRSFLININNYAGKPFVDEAKNWTPLPGRYCSVDDDKATLTIEVGDKVVSTDCNIKDHPLVDRTCYFLDNPNIACQYLAGVIDEDSLLVAAEETEKRSSVIIRQDANIKTLKEKLETLKQEIIVANIQNSKLRDENDKIEDNIDPLRNENADLRRMFSSWRVLALELRSAVSLPLLGGRRAEIDRVIGKFPK